MSSVFVDVPFPSSMVKTVANRKKLSLPNARKSRFRILSSSKTSEGQRQPEEPRPSPLPDTSEEKRSLAAAAGEVFLGLASLLRLRSSAKKKRTTSIDGIDDVFTWEERPADVFEEKAKKDPVLLTSPGFSFSAAGLLFPYHLGVAQLLLDKEYIKDTTPLAGSSAGAILCAVLASGRSMKDTLEITKILAQDCRHKGTAFRLGAVLRDILFDFLPEDAHIRSSERIRIAITQLLWRPRGLLVDKFESREDLINAVITSSFIPGYLAPRPVTLFRNQLCIDGGLTLFMPPTSASKTICVCAFPANQLGLKQIGISPDCNPENRASVRQLFNWALEPADDYILDELYQFGYLDAATWAEKNPVDVLLGGENDVMST